jgi:hypothetical protein
MAHRLREDGLEVLMRLVWTGLVLTVAVLIPNVGSAQVFHFRTPPPEVSAGGADWQLNSEPIVVGGLTYYPTRGFRLFDGQVMAQSGTYERVPVYSDTTMEPYLEVYVPLGSGRMRIYERRRDRETADTRGTDLATEPSAIPSVPPVGRNDVSSAPVGTRGTFVPRPSDSSAIPDRDRTHHTSIITAVPHAGDANGVWLEYQGARWYSDGSAVPFSPDRFEPVGVYQGFPVYRDKIGGGDDLWVAAVKDGPLAPYRKR